MKKHSIWIIILSLISLTGISQPTDTSQWNILLSGTKAGFLKKWKNQDGSFTEWFQYNDRGRGDSTIAHYREDDDGYMIFLDAKGVDYYKKPVFEKFRMENGAASWENEVENEKKDLDQKAIYIPLGISAGTTYKPYFQSPEFTVPLLPAGHSKLSLLQKYELKDGQEIRLVVTHGSSPVPSYSWIDEKDEYFASPGNWFAFIRKGYEYLNEELLKIQNGFKDNYFKNLAENLTQTLSDGLVISNAKLFDPETGEVRKNANIVIGKSRISEIYFGDPKSHPGYQTIDVNGKFVMPGLWDMHVHFGDPSDGLLHLANGVTNVRDMGNGADLLDNKAKIDSGIILGPRIQIMSGFIDGAGKYAGPTGEKINSVEEGKTAIKKYADLGYQQIKLYSSIKPEWVAPLAREAKKYSMRVSGHIPSFMVASEAIDSGYDEIQHANMLFLNFYGKELDTRTPARFSEVARRAASFDFEDEQFKKFIQQLKAYKTVIDPTVSIFEGMFIGEAGKPSPPYASIIDRLPISIQRYFKTGSSLQIPEGHEDTFKRSFTNMLKMVKILYDNQITIVPGTDAFAGFTLHRELENYVKAGIPEKSVLKMATLTSAKVAGKEADFGTIEKGKIADLIVIDGNPLENIVDIRRVELVIKDNNLYHCKEILEAVAIKYFE